jgi:hypothetical protein
MRHSEFGQSLCGIVGSGSLVKVQSDIQLQISFSQLVGVILVQKPRCDYRAHPVSYARPLSQEIMCQFCSPSRPTCIHARSTTIHINFRKSIAQSFRESFIAALQEYSLQKYCIIHKNL